MVLRILRSINHKDLESGYSIPALDNAIIDQKVVGEVIKSHANDWKLAYAFFNWVSKRCGYRHSVEAYNSMIDVLGKALEFDLSWVLIQKMKRDGVCPNYVTFRTMFNRYACAHMVSEAVEAYHLAEDFGLRDRTCFSNLIDALCERKHVVEAEGLSIGENCEYPLDTKTFNILLRGWMKMGWWSKCRSFWEAREQLRVEADLHSYSIYMDILAKSGKPYKAVKLFAEMKKRGIALDVVAYNTAIHSLGLAGDVDQAIHLFHDMLESGHRPTISTYNAILKNLCKAGRAKQALVLLDQMPKRGFPPDAITYHSFFSNVSDPKVILQLFDKMIERGCTPIMDTYVLLIKKFGEWGYLRPVFKIWKTMEEHGISPDHFAYNVLIDTLIRKGCIDLARKYDKEMLARGLSPRPRKELRTEYLSGESDVDCA
uniref:Pentacotripeptide-repeat region of PRORP domain-containing protein n=2 Tax=Nymphaea colorata TaxID=210225 RepID=A0A5K1CEQ1_9MAGN